MITSTENDDNFTFSFAILTTKQGKIMVILYVLVLFMILTKMLVVFPYSVIAQTYLLSY